MVITIVWYWHKGRRVDQGTRLECLGMEAFRKGQVFFNKGGRQVNGERIIFKKL